VSVTILLLATESTAVAAADVLRQGLDAVVDHHESLRSSLQSLRTRDYTLILLDETLAVADAALAERIADSAVAPLLELNLAICSAPRLLRQARAALTRRRHDLAQASVAAHRTLYAELNQTLSGLLLKSEFALRQAPPEAAPHLREVVELAQHLRDQLRP
jgi:hypothetical protein